MSVSLRQILRNIEDNISQKKLELEQDYKDSIDKHIKTVEIKKKEDRLNELKRKLYEKALILEKEDKKIKDREKKMNKFFDLKKHNNISNKINIVLNGFFLIFMLFFYSKHISSYDIRDFRFDFVFFIFGLLLCCFNIYIQLNSKYINKSQEDIKLDKLITKRKILEETTKIQELNKKS